MPSSNDVWEVLSTARTIRRFTDEPVDDATLTRCLEAASWAPNGANAQAWRFVVLRSPEQRAAVAEAARRALAVIEPVYGMSRPADDDQSRFARNNRATYELHDRAGERTSVLFCTYGYETASEILLGGSIYPAMQSFLLAAAGPGPRRLHHELGVLRRRAGAARRSRDPGRVAPRRPRRHRLAAGEPRTGPPPPARRRRRPRSLGSARRGPRRRAHP